MPGAPSTHQYQAARPARSHTSRVVDDLGLAIVSGRQQQGSLLPGDSELIDRYGVSRTVVREALNELPKDQRQLIEFAFLKGLTHHVIAESLGIPLGTVKTNIRRGLLRLRDLLKGGA